MSVHLASLRRRIDVLDRKLVGLLNERTRVALTIRQAKEGMGRARRSHVREAQVLRNVALANRGPTSQKSMERLFRAILRISI